MAVNALEGALGDKVTGSTPADRQKSIESAILGGDPATLLKVRESENALTEKMAELGIQKDQLVYNDLASARAMQGQTRDPTPRQLSWVVVGGFIAMSLLTAAACITWPTRVAQVSTAAWTLLTTLLTFLAAEAKQACTFWFGSSSDSQAKTQTLSEIAKS